MNNLIDEIICSYNKLFHTRKQLTIGLSGGVDSVVLLHLFNQLRYKHSIDLKAVHINHGISANADSWEEFCKKLCIKLGIPLSIFRCKISKFGGESLENNARDARYEIFSQLDTEVIVLAHHKNDQIETMLSQILRGSDIHNIASMQSVSEKYGKLFWRPLLFINRAEIELFAKNNQIVHIEDESNYDTKYLRNFVRHQIIPDMLAWDSTVIGKLINVISHVQDAVYLIDELALADLSLVSHDIVDDGISLSVEKFKSLSSQRQINLLNYYIRTQNLPIPSRKKIQEFCRQVTVAAWDRHPKLDINAKYYLYKVKNHIKLINH